VADIRQQQGPVQINHFERRRVVSILANLPNDIALEDAVARIDEQIIQPMRDQGQINNLYNVTQAGAADDLTKLRKELSADFIIAVLLIYLLMAALFQSFLYPLVVMFTVPLAMFGGVLGLDLLRIFDPHTQLDILTMLCFVILVGTVVNNSILIVHYALQLLRVGWDPRSAVKESVRVRVRPIFMTTGTSNLGMLPLVVMPGAGSELYRGIGAVIIGGLAFSTIVTLVLTPLVFSYTIELALKVKRLLGLEEQVVTTAPTIEEAPEGRTV
jgi:HAE1 family hydrophobic/amphiphilic exporter-1